MRAARLLLAFAAGLFLYQAAVVLVGGFLSAVAVPKAYFDWFGRSSLELSLALLQFFGFALPISVLVAGGTLSVLRILGRDAKATLWAVLAGLVVCFVFWLSAGVFALPPDPSIEHYPPLVLLRQALFPPWWATLHGLASRLLRGSLFVPRQSEAEPFLQADVPSARRLSQTLERTNCYGAR